MAVCRGTARATSRIAPDSIVYMDLKPTGWNAAVRLATAAVPSQSRWARLWSHLIRAHILPTIVRHLRVSGGNCRYELCQLKTYFGTPTCG